MGVSRPTVVKLLETGEISFEQPGRHRRVRLADVLAYRQRASTERRAALDRMVEIADEADMCERTATPNPPVEAPCRSRSCSTRACFTPRGRVGTVVVARARHVSFRLPRRLHDRLTMWPIANAGLELSDR